MRTKKFDAARVLLEVTPGVERCEGAFPRGGDDWFQG